MRFRWLWLILAAALLLACTGCTVVAGNDPTDSSKEERSFEIEITDNLQEIIDRGYLKVACKDDVPEFGYYDEESGTFEGGEIELAYYIAAKIFNVTYEEAREQELVLFSPVETTERENVLTEGEADYVIATYTITEARSEIVDFSDVYYTSSVGLMINKSNVDDASLREERIRSVVDLDGKTVGVISNSTTRDDFVQYLQRNSLQVAPKFAEYPTYDALSEALASEAIDVFSVDVTILRGYLTDDREILADRFSPQDYGVASQKDREGLVEAANAVIAELEYNGIVLFE